MKKISYDFSDLQSDMYKLKNDPSTKTATQVKNELNRFFKDSKCRDVMCTLNTDKPFFGMCVLPVISGDTATRLITSDDKLRITEYYVEIDSKLLAMNFTARELTAMLLHEVGHIVNDSVPAEEIRIALDQYLADNNETLTLSNSVKYKDILSFGIKKAMVNLTSLFHKKDEEIIADQFVVLCGYGPDLESAFKRITKNVNNLNRGVPKFIALQWTLRLYKDIKFKRIAALHTINRCKQQTASVLEKREMENLARRLNQIDDNDLIRESVNLIKKACNIYSNFKYKGLRNLEDDLYELNLRVKNCDSQDEALTLLRMINTRMAIIDDYLQTESDLHEDERTRWGDLYNKYGLLRTDLSKKSVYGQKAYGLFVQTPIIKSRYDI